MQFAQAIDVDAAGAADQVTGACPVCQGWESCNLQAHADFKAQLVAMIGEAMLATNNIGTFLDRVASSVHDGVCRLNGRG